MAATIMTLHGGWEVFLISFSFLTLGWLVGAAFGVAEAAFGGFGVAEAAGSQIQPCALDLWCLRAKDNGKE